MKKLFVLLVFTAFFFLQILSVASASYELDKKNVELEERAAPYVISVSDLIEQEKALAEVRQLEQGLQSLLATAKTPKERDKILKLLAQLAEEHKGISAETKEYIKGFIDKTVQLPGMALEANPGFTGDISDVYASKFGETLFTGEKVDPAEVAAYAQVPFLTYRQGKIITEGAETAEKIVGKILGKGEAKITGKGLSKAEKFVEKAKTAIKDLGEVKKLEMIQPSIGVEFTHGELATREVQEVISALKSGALSPSDIPIRFVRIDGRNIIVNNRSFSAIKAAGLEPVVLDFTGVPWAEKLARDLLKQRGGQAFDILEIKL